jgi:hypothetical protein
VLDQEQARQALVVVVAGQLGEFGPFGAVYKEP